VKERQSDASTRSAKVSAVTFGTATGGASRQAIEHHYDVGRDFYGLWLDSRMVYSCAYWPGELDADLEAAQVAKLDWHATAARVDGAARVLDVGCGWGAMLSHLTGPRNVGSVTGLTLSADQAGYIRDHQPAADVRLEDWRDHQADAPYDAIISIGAFEHFARPELTTTERRGVYRDFFERCAGWLPPQGRLSLQTIGYEDFDPTKGPVSAFFTQDVFPESTLPFLSDIVVAAEPSFRICALRNDGDQYEQTLKLWQGRLEAGKDEATSRVGRDTYRHYLRYLRVSRAMFDRRVCTLYRLVLERRPSTLA
jgi:cyclopropane-fatty-acyl-phospholipid synthase